MRGNGEAGEMKNFEKYFGKIRLDSEINVDKKTKGRPQEEMCTLIKRS